MTASQLQSGIHRRAMARYMAAMQDCQIPVGPLAVLNYIEYYVYTLERGDGPVREDAEPRKPSRAAAR
jgi:hypothetical protein